MPRKLRLNTYLLGVVALWALAASTWAAYVFLVPHDSNFAPEIGARGAFLAFLILGSIPYFVLAFVFGVAIMIGSAPDDDARQRAGEQSKR